ncbi:MAG: hypothetical protein KGD59_09300 [Candidatus Heimdallarchaeota archaeon]|nr:hypothetical protein [Candidatus Heimdallarchaeota archaeon]MBY8994730.1 hypothetical protein [Candidatus Heimdallarchaeota archaeon]
MDDKVKLPLWLRIFYLVFGVVIIGFAVIVFINIPLVFIDNILILGIAITAVSIPRLLAGLFDKRLTKSLKTFNVIVGLLILPIGIIAIIWTSLGFLILIDILALAIMMIGILGILQGVEDKSKVRIYRVTINLIGFILIGLAATVLIMDSIFTDLVLVSLLSTGLLIIGLRRLVEGIVDHRIFKQPHT